jgi:hypothetical protein
MLTTWVLIIAMSGAGGMTGVISVEMGANEATCLQALAQIKADRHYTGVCLKRDPDAK